MSNTPATIPDLPILDTCPKSSQTNKAPLSCSPIRDNIVQPGVDQQDSFLMVSKKSKKCRRKNAQQLAIDKIRSDNVSVNPAQNNVNLTPPTVDASFSKVKSIINNFETPGRCTSDFHMGDGSVTSPRANRISDNLGFVDPTPCIGITSESSVSLPPKVFKELDVDDVIQPTTYAEPPSENVSQGDDDSGEDHDDQIEGSSKPNRRGRLVGSKNKAPSDKKKKGKGFPAYDSSLHAAKNSISKGESNLLKQNFTIDEIRKAINSLCNDKALRPDGLPVEFYKANLKWICFDLLDIYDEALGKGSLGNVINKGIIKLIPKDGDKALVKNRRPITLLNVSYKILAKMLAVRLEKILPKFIYPTQTSFIKGRYILENLITSWEAVEWSKISSQDTAMFLLDFEKAYDRVEWDFIITMLEAFGFPSEFCTYVKVLLQDASAHIEVNGSLSSSIMLSRSIRQGCPLAPALFIIASDALFYLLRDNSLSPKVASTMNAEGHKLLMFLKDGHTTMFINEMKDGYVWRRNEDNLSSFEEALKKLNNKIKDSREPSYAQVEMLAQIQSQKTIVWMEGPQGWTTWVEPHDDILS
ncbi:uncharacterized protein LOC131858359 [Cryptomeria japonica]|uniref:uncharacterized protein LOC131858359 n=1 Tax=Cryptomeria japonica TaxID=3369 RepID=UPI0027D9D0D1|nr:uncharacterized protein LOC131858359 [Cryptomeria japonica]